MRRSYAVAGGAVLAAMVAASLWLMLFPKLALPAIQSRITEQLGRTLEVKGGARLSFAPLAFSLGQISLSAPQGMEGPLVTADTLRIPVGLPQLFGASPDLSLLTLEKADIALLVDERDQVNWHFASAPGSPLALHLSNSAVRYFDARNNQALALANVNGDLGVGSDGGVTFIGSSEINGRLARYDMELKSLARVHEDGSPITLSFETPEIKAGFDGRLSTVKVFNLVGPVDISITSLRQAARWAGLGIEDGRGFGPLTISGALDSSGKAFAIRQANVTLDDVTVFGELAIDTRNATPKIQAQLSAPTFTLDGFLPDSGATPENWGRSPLGFAALRAFDTEITLETPSLTFGTLKEQPARMVVSSTGGKFDASLAVMPADGTRFVAEANIDATASPPSFALTLKSDNASAGQVLQLLTGQDWVSGTGAISAALSGSGDTQEQIIGTLKGKASVTLGAGAIAGPDIVAMLGQASQRILTGWSLDTPSRTAFSSLALDVTMADGIATLGAAALDAPGLKVSVTGDIDFLRRAVDLRADPKLIAADRDVSGLPVKIVVNGPWGAPRIYPDVPGLLLDPQKGFETLKSMGLASGN
mgnify:CR=1 FL=1